MLIQALLPLPERGSDFRAFYTAASVPLGKLYDLEYVAAFENDLWKDYGHHTIQPFPRPPLYALLLKPLSLLGYRNALHLWLGILSVAFLACAWLVRRLYGGGFGIFVLMASFYPVSFALTIGQDSALVLAALLLTIHFHREKREWISAFFLSLAFQKFHLLLLVPLAFLIHGRRSFLAKWLCWVAVWLGLNTALIGIPGWRSYLQMLDAGIVDRLFERAWNLRSTAFHFGWGQAGFAVAAILVLLWFLWLGARLRLEAAFWTAVAFSSLLAWHSLKYDYAVAMPLFYLLWAKHRVWLAAAFLFGGLWVHALVWERETWIIAPLVLAMSVELWWRKQRTDAADSPDAAEAVAA